MVGLDAASTPRGGMKRLPRRKSRPEPLESADPISPTVYDWLSLCFLCLKMKFTSNDIQTSFSDEYFCASAF